ncbi:MAG: WcaF family extracellular polysaccharide biosynthesis acetyltransferase [Candidatus Methylacidiphilales bacterium]
MTERQTMEHYDNRSFNRGASFFKEALWRLCQGLFFQPLWHMPSGFRAWVLRCFGARIGKRAVIRAGVNISFPWRLEMGDDVWLGEEVMILSLAPVRIGSNVCLSQRAFLCTGSHRHGDPGFALETAPIHIEDGCWVAAMAFIGPGVTLGKGALAGAGAVVLRDVPAGAKVFGVPARVAPAPENREPHRA